ncbi:hypothetical protein DIPPA_05249 [Diplonema papillatum]|nr:hypothetical protein DIPPA_05249 [Diplonema papillatum]
MATPPTPILSRTSRGGVLSQTARTNSDASGASVKTVQQSPLTLPNAAAAAAAARSGPRPLARKVRLSLGGRAPSQPSPPAVAIRRRRRLRRSLPSGIPVPKRRFPAVLDPVAVALDAAVEATGASFDGAAFNSGGGTATRFSTMAAATSRRGSAQGSSTTTATGDSGSSSSGGGTNASGASSRTVQPVAVDVTSRNQELWVQGGSPLARPSF